MKNIKKLIFLLTITVVLISCSSSKFYTVKKGDSLYTISKKKKISITELKKINNLDSNNIYPGQKLYLKPPRTKTSKESYHIVQSGDTLYGISQKYGVSIAELKKINNLKNNILYKGDKIYLGKHSTKTTNLHSRHSKNTALRNFHKPLKTMVVTSPFGYREHPVLGRKILHTGVDLRASMNTPVYSPANGVVTYAGWMNGYGKIIIINNGNGYETRFAHLNRFLVKKGERVTRGKVIAKTGRTGRVTGPHLHYEIRHNNKPINPMR